MKAQIFNLNNIYISPFLSSPAVLILFCVNLLLPFFFLHPGVRFGGFILRFFMLGMTETVLSASVMAASPSEVVSTPCSFMFSSCLRKCRLLAIVNTFSSCDSAQTGPGATSERVCSSCMLIGLTELLLMVMGSVFSEPSLNVWVKLAEMPACLSN